MPTLLVVEDNTAPNYVFTLERDGTAIDLTTATAISMIIKNDRTGTITNAGSALGKVSATAGTVRYTPVAADFPSEGRYVCDVQITWTGGTIERLREQVIVASRAKIA